MIKDDFTIVDGGPTYQKDVERLPKRVKQDLIKQLEILKRNPFDGTDHLQGRYAGYRKKRLVENYRFVFHVNLNSKKIIPAEVKHRGPSYHM